MCTTPDYLPCEDTVPDLDLVHPGSARGCEMKNNTVLLLVQPVCGLGRGMHRGIVEHHMDLLTGICSHHFLHQPEKVRCRMRRRQRSDDLTCANIDRSVHINSSRAHIIMSTLLGLAERYWQQGLGAIQRLDTCLDVDRHDHLTVRRTQVQPDNIPHLVLKIWIPGNFERALPPRFEPVLTPQLTHP